MLGVLWCIEASSAVGTADTPHLLRVVPQTRMGVMSGMFLAILLLQFTVRAYLPGESFLCAAAIGQLLCPISLSSQSFCIERLDV